MSLDVSRIVDVQISVQALALQRAGFGILNIVGTSDVIPISERIRSYDNITGVAEDFAVTDEEYKSASIFFQQTPRPTPLYISRRVSEAIPAHLYGSSADVETSLTAWNVISDGNITLFNDIVADEIALTGMDFSSITSMDDVASVVQAKLDSEASGGMTCKWDGSRFVFATATTGSSAVAGWIVDDSISGTYVGGMLAGEETNSGAFLESGVDAESIQTSLNAIEAINSKWYGFGFTKEVRDDSQTSAGTQADCLDAGEWAEARIKTFWNNSSDANTLVGTDTTNISYKLEQLGYSRSITVYNAGDYPAVSAFARGATVDFNGTNTTITYKFKQLPGIIASDLSATQANAAIDFNANYYANFGTQLSGDAVAILAEGVVANGRFIDEVVGIDWLQNAIQTDIFNYLYQSTTKIPQTDEGVAGISQVLAGVLDQAVNNGLLAPGFVTIDNDEVYLPKGYEIFTGLVEDQSQADREARKAPPIAFVAKGAGAIHSVTIQGTFVR